MNDQPVRNRSSRAAWCAWAITLAITAAVLRSFGRRWWCACGGWTPWSWEVWSSHNSQHLIDWYSPSHLLHGLIFYALLCGLKRAYAVRFSLAMALEAGWEMLENSSLIINRYRAVTASLDYFGDSILNSLSDISCCACGFWLAARLPPRWSVAIFVLSEALTTALIRDGLLLNILMLVAPSESVRAWQMAGH